MSKKGLVPSRSIASYPTLVEASTTRRSFLAGIAGLGAAAMAVGIGGCDLFVTDTDGLMPPIHYDAADARPLDARQPDARLPDAHWGPWDSGGVPPDVRMPDARPDADPPDATERDGGTPDGGTPDAP